MIKALVIDDEKKICEMMVEMLAINCPNIHVLGTADSVKSGLIAIKQHKPDLVFLDIKLPDGTAFDILQQLDPINFKIIFVTAFEEFAVQAFRFSALDYIVKPIESQDLINAVEKAERFIQHELSTKLSTFLTNFQNTTKEEKKIVLKTIDKIHVISIKDIIRCESDKGYTEFFLVNGKKLITSTTLKEYEDMLTAYGFYRVHHQHLINLDYIEYFDKKDSGNVVMKDGVSVPVSLRKKESFLKIFGSL